MDWNRRLANRERITDTGERPTYLHEYAVALLHDELSCARGPVRVQKPDGSMSGDLLEGVGQPSHKHVAIPTSVESIRGFQPDLVLYSEGLRSIRVVEVEVTAKTPQEKVERLRNAGIDVVQVQVREWKDLGRLCWKPIPPQYATNLQTDELRGAYGLHDKRSSGVDGPLAFNNRHRQNNYDTQVLELCHALYQCTPELRREFLEILKTLDSPESLYPLSLSSPAREILGEC